MSLTPRQIWAYLEFNEKIDHIEDAKVLQLNAISAQGDSKTIEKARKALSEWPSKSR